MAVTGSAPQAGTTRYAEHVSTLHPGHMRSFGSLRVTSIGLGTYLGDADDATDELYGRALETALARGCNVLDTAINYRCQRSERTIGATLERLIAEGTMVREAVVVCTKGGYLPFDGQVPDDPNRYILETFVHPGLIRPDELVAGCHCLSPAYLEHQLSTSLKNLRLDTLDAYYLHNPEQQLDEVSRPLFLARMETAFHLLERMVEAGRIRMYGTATWQGFRVSLIHRNYLALEELISIARTVGGDDHHFRVIQLPYNLAMPEAASFANQMVDGQLITPLEAAQALGLSVAVSASLLQSQLARLPSALERLIPGLASDAQRALQFVRSTPGVSTALVGMKQPVHVEDNLALAHIAPLSPAQIGELFQRRRT